MLEAAGQAAAVALTRWLQARSVRRVPDVIVGCRRRLASPARRAARARRRRPPAPAPGGGTRSGSRRRTDAAAARASSTRRCPSAAPSARPPTSPTPSSRTSIQSLSPSRRAEMSMCPGPAFRATPCLMAFSTSGCRSRLGHQRVERLGLDVEADDQPIGEARLLDLRGTSTRNSELGLERDLLLAEVSRASCAADRSAASACDRRPRRPCASAPRSRAAC